MNTENSGIGEISPDILAEQIKRLVIGYMPSGIAKGLPCLEATVSFQDGDLLFPILNALIYKGNELSIGGRSIALEERQELWIVNLRTKENPTRIERHNESPNVELRGWRSQTLSNVRLGF
jgi:hypothetical protein